MIKLPTFVWALLILVGLVGIFKWKNTWEIIKILFSGWIAHTSLNNLDAERKRKNN